MKVIAKELPLEIKIRISEIEKTLFNIKALKVGDKINAKVLRVMGEECLLELKGFRLKARVKFKVNVGEELTLKVVEKGDSIKFELLRNREIDDSMIKVIKEISKASQLSKEIKEALNELKSTLNTNKEQLEDLKRILDKVSLEISSEKAPSLIESKFSKFMKSEVENSIAKIIRFLVSRLPDKGEGKTLEGNLKEVLGNLIKENRENIKSIFKEQKAENVFNKDFFNESDSAKKIPKELKEGLEKIIKTAESIKNHNLSLKETSVHNNSISLTSFIIPLFSAFEGKVNFAKVDYKREEKTRKFKLDKVSLLLHMSNIGRVIVNLRKIGKALQVEFLTESENSKKLLFKEIESLKNKLSPWFDSILTTFKISKKDFEEFFEERIESKTGAIDIKV